MNIMTSLTLIYVYMPIHTIWVSRQYNFLSATTLPKPLHSCLPTTQESTFANWANDKLRSHGISVNHLQKDLRDGVKVSPT